MRVTVRLLPGMISVYDAIYAFTPIHPIYLSQDPRISGVNVDGSKAFFQRTTVGNCSDS